MDRLTYSTPWSVVLTTGQHTHGSNSGPWKAVVHGVGEGTWFRDFWLPGEQMKGLSFMLFLRRQ
ncbi:MAG: hypothetical protein ACU84Q_03775 [Gammaproteobacteria bacterium]